MDIVILEMTSTATIAITLFGIVFCFMQTEYSRVSQSFAVFLVAIAANNTPEAFKRVFETLEDAYVESLDLLLWAPSSFCLAPLFWIYVYTLTSPAQQRPRKLYRHLVLPGLATLVGVLLVLGPEDARALLQSGDGLPSSIWSTVLVLLLGVLYLALYPQMAFYLFMIVRRLLRYRRLLRDYYASTEEHELRWVYVIGTLGGLFWLAATLHLYIAFDPDGAGLTPAANVFASIAGLGLVAATVLWGLRQRPPLVPQGEDAPERPRVDGQPPVPQVGKYEKSALNAEVSNRIARKLRAAMETDHLHRDPNLSLWSLARHIGAPPNYVSQTLNEVIGENFFDFVNGYRITEAKTLLSTTDDTVLAITYEVGFNARSSFYNAFKRVTGQTPTVYRKHCLTLLGQTTE